MSDVRTILAAVEAAGFPVHYVDRHAIVHGDCGAVLPLLPAGCVDAAVTSPPYAMQRSATYGGVPEADYPAWTVAWMAALRAALNPRGSVMVNIRENISEGVISDYVHRTRLAVRGDGWAECEELIWRKRSCPPLGSNFRPRRAWERVLWFAKSGDVWVDSQANGNADGCVGFVPSRAVVFARSREPGWHANTTAPTEGATRCTDIVEAGFGPRDDTPDVHPARYPVELPRWLARLVTPPAGLVLDPFGGSCTTAVAAHVEGRTAICIERDAAYVALSVRRLTEATRQGSLFDAAGGVA